MKERESNVLSLLEDRTNHYSRKIALGMKTQFGWKELTYDGLGLLFYRNQNRSMVLAFLRQLFLV